MAKLSIKCALLATALSLTTLPYHKAFAADQADKQQVEKKTEEPCVQEKADKDGDPVEQSEACKEKAAEELAEIEPAAGPLAAIGMGPVLLGAGGAAAIGGVAAASGGGGGDSPSAPVSGGGGGAPADDPDDDTPVLTETETEATKGLPTIKAQAAYNRGYTGDGVLIGIVDSGIFKNHVDLGDKVTECYKADTAEIGCDKVQVDFHGTHVAGIAAAKKNDIGMHGIAYNADIVHADIFVIDQASEKVSGVSFDKQAAAYNWMVGQGAKVTNNSYGVVGTHEDYTVTAINNTFDNTTPIGQAYRNAIDNDVILVWSAGNAGEDEAGLMAALPLYFPEFEDLWVAVTAVSNNGGALSSYSNKCGAAADFCISAPGGEFNAPNDDGGILSVYTQDYFYAYAAGTSMSAPHVTGGIAILLEAFGPGTASNMTPEEVVDLMFATANKSGIYADTATYGQGLLDLDAATTPGAPLLLATTGTFSGGALLGSTTMTLGPAFGDAPVLALSGLSAGAHDQYGRIFNVDLGSLVSMGSDRYDVAKILKGFAAGDTKTVDMGDIGSLSFSYGQGSEFDTPFDRGEDKQSPEIDKLSFRAQTGKFTAMDVHYGVNPGNTFGLHSESALGETLLAADDKSFNPYLGFAGDNTITTGMSLTQDELSIHALGFTNMAEKSDPFYGMTEEQDRVAGSAVEVSYQADEKLRLSLISGTMRENEDVLGMRSNGAFGFDDETYTFFSGVNASYALNDDIKLIGGWQFGWTDAAVATDSLFSDFSTIETDSFTLGLTGQNTFRENDSWALVVHQPVRVTKADADINVPIARANDGSVIYDQGRADLAPEGRELNLQGVYSFSLGDNHDFSAGLSFRMQPGHVQDADDEGIGLVRYRFKF